MATLNPQPTRTPQIDGARPATVTAITKDGLITVRLGEADIDCLFVRSAATAPDIQPGDTVLMAPPATGETTGYVLGLIEPYIPKPDRLAEKLTRGRPAEQTTIEDQIVRIKADKGLVIECGKGAIIITQDGKVQIKGEELLSRARRMHRIKGAGVNIN